MHCSLLCEHDHVSMHLLAAEAHHFSSLLGADAWLPLHTKKLCFTNQQPQRAFAPGRGNALSDLLRQICIMTQVSSLPIRSFTEVLHKAAV